MPPARTGRGPAIAVGIGVLTLGCHKPAPAAVPAPCTTATLAAERTGTPPRIDGELREPGWLTAARTPPLVDDTDPRAIVPHSEVRAMWDDRALYLSFYAADENLESTDWFGAALAAAGGLLELQVSPKGTLTCLRAGHVIDCHSLAGVMAAVDTDGTIDDPRDDDEEWTVELVIPWSALELAQPPAELPIEFARSDRPKQHPLYRLVWTPGCPRGVEGRLMLHPGR